VARFRVEQVERLLADPGIIRNRAKIEATINNARRYDDLATEFGSLASYVWQYEPDPQARPPVLDHAALLQSDGQVGPQTSAKPSPRICRGSCSEFFRSGDRSTSVLLRDAGTPEVLTEGWDWSLLDGVAAEFRRGGP
jgi:3-methyladenine DNA glycosylase Tag